LEEVVNPWQGRRVFLTGHTGFKGGWLSLLLSGMGAEIRGYALDPGTEPNLFTAASVASVLDDTRGDIRDFASLKRAMIEFHPEVVFHLAAQPLVRKSYADPLGTYAINVQGTAHVLEAVREVASVRSVVCITTDKCYENREWFWPYREIDPLGGYDPYSSSKACAEIVTAAYRNSFFSAAGNSEPCVGIATVRAGNVIGGGDWSDDRLIPDLIRGFRARKPVLIRRPKSIRPWQHVLEPLHGYIKVAEKLLAGQAQFASSFNFGPADEDAWAVEKIATKLAESWGNGASWECDADPGVHEAHYLRLDSSKARMELGWRPRLDLEAALEWTVSWYRAWHEGGNMLNETRGQIARYERLFG
jgi:CDP-glucose 4,6-dehydratase